MGLLRQRPRRPQNWCSGKTTRTRMIDGNRWPTLHRCPGISIIDDVHEARCAAEARCNKHRWCARKSSGSEVRGDRARGSGLLCWGKTSNGPPSIAIFSSLRHEQIVNIFSQFSGVIFHPLFAMYLSYFYYLFNYSSDLIIILFSIWLD